MKLYHYTSVDSLFEMFDKSIRKDDKTCVKYLELWAYPASKMNDINEYRLFTNKLKKKVKEYAQKNNHALTEKELETLEKLCQCNLYTISFTDKSESQHMWEYYGDNHVGICIEFDLDVIPPFYSSKDGHLIMENAYNSLLTRCKYVQPEHLEIEKDLMIDIYKYIIDCGDSNVIKGVEILTRLENTAIVYKNTNFSQESEFRFVLGSIKSEEHLICPIPISAITSITLGSAMKDEAKIKLISQKVLDALGGTVNIIMSKLRL